MFKNKSDWICYATLKSLNINRNLQSLFEATALVDFKRLCSRGVHDLFNHYLFKT